MNDKRKLTAIFVFTALFTVLFYQQSAGINILIFETVYLSFILLYFRQALKSALSWLLFGGTLITAVFTVITNSTFVIFYNCISLMLLSGILILPQAASVISVGALAFYNLLLAQLKSFEMMVNYKSEGSPFKRIIHYAKIIIIPLVIILGFIFIYKGANPVFSDYSNTVTANIGTFFSTILERIDFWLVTTIALGFLVSNVLIYQNQVAGIVSYDSRSDVMIRMRNTSFNAHLFKINALKNEFRAAVFLFSALNVLLLVVNIIDISWVWFSFEWSGQYLRQFVHEGTWLLIVSIMISMILVLFFFRGNLNFFTRNKSLRYLSYAWLMQNIILAVSVGIRNLYYIQHFALAYKRIGVLVFLLLVIFGLLSVMHKIHNRKSAFFTTRINAFAIYITLMVVSLFNWDGIIARYNFSHYQTAFVHLDFLASLSDKTLPDLVKSDAELEAISKSQEQLFHFEYHYMKPQQYKAIIQDRSQSFMERWDNKGWLSWNWAEYKAAKQLTAFK